MYAFVWNDDARMTLKRHDQIYNLLTMTMGLDGERKSNGRELVSRMSVEQRSSGNKFLFGVWIVFFFFISRMRFTVRAISS